MYRGFEFDVLDDGFVFIWYRGKFIAAALNEKYAKKRVDDVISQTLKEHNISAMVS